MSNIEIINSDCLDYLAGAFCPQFDLIIADPPFNIGHKYQGFLDKMPEQGYSRFTSHWINACYQKLKPGAAMVLHGSVEVSRQILLALDYIKLLTNIETEICWAYNFGQHSYNNFIQTHCRAIVVRKPGPRKWYVENVLTPSKRLLMGDKRVQTAEHKGYVPFGTVWGIKTDEDQVPTEPIEGLPNWGRIQGNNKERRHGHPNQLPQRYVERFIAAYSEPGDVIFDPFAGSGTTAICARKMYRHCITTDISEWNVNSIKQNLDKLKL